MPEHDEECVGCNLCDEILMDLDPMEKYFRAWRATDG